MMAVFHLRASKNTRHLAICAKSTICVNFEEFYIFLNSDMQIEALQNIAYIKQVHLMIACQIQLHIFMMEKWCVRMQTYRVKDRFRSADFLWISASISEIRAKFDVTKKFFNISDKYELMQRTEIEIINWSYIVLFSRFQIKSLSSIISFIIASVIPLVMPSSFFNMQLK